MSRKKQPDGLESDRDSADQERELITLGRLTSAYGVKGWIKVVSHTDPVEAILDYRPWYVKPGHSRLELEVDANKRHGKGLIVHFPDCDSRDTAEKYVPSEIMVYRSQLPELGENEIYWQELMGLRVINQHGADLGIVDHLLETGANDVLVVRADEMSIDSRERLVPFLAGSVIVDVDQCRISVDWEADY